MDHEVSKDDNPNSLNLEQQHILESFIRLYYPRPKDPSEIAITDQSIAAVRENLTEGFGLKLEEPHEFFAVMAGFLAATDKIVRLSEIGIAPSVGAEVLRHSLAGLAPHKLTPNNQPE